MNEEGNRTDAAAPTSPDARLPYEKPAVSWEQPLETQPSLMVGCGKSPGDSDPCGSTGPIAS
ncbi:MAG TPA: hypothetical protein VL691_12060 [Vicinamibacteria bacterium]|nr:hypothetical protein [Vicinamibacteria bacterium]